MVRARNLCVVVIDFYELLRKMGLSFFLKTRFGSSYPSRWTSSCFLQKFQELFWKATANKGVLLLVLVMVLCLNLFQVFRVLFIYLFLFIICRRWVKIGSFLLRCKTHAQPSSRTHALHVRIRIQTRTSAQTHIARTHASHSRRTRTHIYTHARMHKYRFLFFRSCMQLIAIVAHFEYKAKIRISRDYSGSVWNFRKQFGRP